MGRVARVSGRAHAGIAMRETLCASIPPLADGATSKIVQGMPNGDKQEIRVLTASFQPGDRTLFHTHRFPVTVYVLEGAFTMEMEGREPVTAKAGEAMMMPTHVKMTGYNRSSTDALRLVVFYVSDPDTPFLDPIH